MLNNNETELNDLSPMPFGKYKGTPMQDVPASYLWYIWDTGAKNDKTPIANYIRKSLSALKQEYPDSIWS